MGPTAVLLAWLALVGPMRQMDVRSAYCHCQSLSVAFTTLHHSFFPLPTFSSLSLPPCTSIVFDTHHWPDHDDHQPLGLRFAFVIVSFTSTTEPHTSHTHKHTVPADQPCAHTFESETRPTSHQPPTPLSCAHRSRNPRPDLTGQINRSPPHPFRPGDQ